MRVNTRYINSTEVHLHTEVHTEDAPLVDLMYLVFTRMPGESYRRRLFFVVVLVLRISSANGTRNFDRASIVKMTTVALSSALTLDKCGCFSLPSTY